MIKTKVLIYIQLFLVLFMGVGVSLFHLPNSIKYVTDVITVLLFALTVPLYKEKLKNIKNKKGFYAIAIFSTYCLINMIIGGAGIVLSIWAIRVTFRFIIFFVSCVCLLDNDDLKKILKILENVYIINFFIILFQFFVQGYRQDFLGGIFGVEKGCNGSLNLFVVILLCYEFYKFFSKQSSIGRIMIYCAIAFIIAALAELKFLYIEILIILTISVFTNKISIKTILITVLAILGFIVGMFLLQKYFPYAFAVFKDRETISNYLSASWSETLQVTRTTGITVINKYFIEDSMMNKIFGLGLGNCEISSFFSSDFATKYFSTNYRQFTFSMQYLETGIVGLMLYLGIYIAFYKDANSNETMLNNKFYLTLIILIFFNVWYNDSCKTEIAYILYLLLSTIYFKDIRDGLK